MASSDLSEKLKALQDRDKGLRESRERHTDITTATAVVGTCNDMCPEVERVWREETKQVSPLEMDSEGRADHHAMVKEYRRAGADQSEPLAHEMRPGPVLERTMNYLLCNIMDKPESNPEIIEEWYDFLWSRTRAIRKDITQQHFCDLSSVALLEKCTRFHIHCAATLVEQDAAIFTPKINDENLSKCLQSLKDFYHDLAAKNEKKCPNEAEFRGYEILLKLRDDNVLREIKNLDPDIRDSDPVTFASDAYFAFNSNNYVRFFQLVNSTTYLNACLLHRYFLPVRILALKLMRRAYNPKMETTESYPLDSFCKQLAFDSYHQAEIFLSHFGLEIADNCILLTRERTSDNSESPPVVRSLNLVEGKRRGITAGEIVNGGPLPENPYKKYPLHSSFDSSGTLKTEDTRAKQPQSSTLPTNQPPLFGAVATSNQIFGNTSSQAQFSFKSLFGQNSNKPSENVFTPIDPIKPQVDVDKELTNLADSEVIGLMTDVVKSEVTKMIRNAVRDEMNDRVSVSLAEEVFSQSLDLFLRQIVDQALKEAREEVAVAKKRSMMLQVADDLSNRVVGEVILFEVENICKEVHSKSSIEYREMESHKIFKYLIRKVVEDMAVEVVNSCYLDAVNERNRTIQDQLEKRQSKLAKKYFKVWLAKYRRRKRSRTIKETFPASSFSGEVKLVVTQNKPVTRRSLRRKLNGSEVEDGGGQKIRTPKRTKNGSLKRLSSASSLGHVSTVSAMTELVAVRDNPDPKARLRYLELEIEEQKKASRRMNEVVDVISRSFVVMDELEAKAQKAKLN